MKAWECKDGIGRQTKHHMSATEKLAGKESWYETYNMGNISFMTVAHLASQNQRLNRIGWVDAWRRFTVIALHADRCQTCRPLHGRPHLHTVIPAIQQDCEHDKA